jgi:hypothetical protein
MITLALIAVAVALGVVVNRVLIAAAHRRHEATDAEGISITDIAGIIPTMSVLLLAFIMVAAFDSWNVAGETASKEANQVVAVARTARFLPNEAGAEIARNMKCYAIAVQKSEWPVMDDEKKSNIPDYWDDQTNKAIQDARKDGGDVALDLVSLERDLSEARQVRLAQSEPSVPAPMTWLMVASVVMSVFFLGMLAHVSIRTPVQLVALVGTTVILSASLLLINEMDSPYTGITKIAPDAMRHASTEVTEELADYTQRQPPPCDSKGVPSTDGSFHAENELIS